MKHVKLAHSTLLLGLTLLTSGCELIAAPDHSLLEGGRGGGQDTGGGGAGAAGGGGFGGEGGTGAVGGTGGAGGMECTPVDDQLECTDDLCEGGVPVNEPKAAGVDCAGGVCDGAGECVECIDAADCNDPQLTCSDNLCVDVSCMDGELNGDETDVDCGGSCAPANLCADGDSCLIGADCVTGVCDDLGAGLVCQGSACDDGVQNGDETDVDCGGSCAPANLCADGEGCLDGVDCESGVCTGGQCEPGACGDGVVNQLSEACDDGNLINGDACDNNCTVPGCGNGVVRGTESCDDGNVQNGDGCDNNCTVSGCGNGQVGGTELCDDGNVQNGDGCDDGPGGNCTATGCGNGVVTGTEACDDGNAINGDTCDNNCTVPGCGNGVVTGTEACDDGNATNDDGCDDGPGGNCTATGCGNGVVTGTEACDDGNAINGDTCDNNCTVPGCGNGIVRGTEACDDGNLVNGDGCDANCTNTGCGNGVTTGLEICDDGNLVNGDGCDANCTNTGCGNGIITGLEVCDDGNLTGGDGCSATCTAELVESEPNGACGSEDGPFVVNPSVNVIGQLTPVGDLDLFAFTLPGPGVSSVRIETFTGVVPGACAAGNDTLLQLRGTDCSTILAADDDDGLNFCSLINAAGADAGARKLPPGTYFVRTNELDDDATIANYNVTVTVLSTCGNGGAAEPTEACDDGNLTSGDGCDANCTLSACGNGLVAGAEACDDGNVTSGDGCSASCTVEAGYSCTGSAPSVCSGVCGNGSLQSNESCEDGNTASGDCCSATCQLELCETEANNACGTDDPMPMFALAPPISYAGGAITPSGDVDLYSFTLTRPASVRIETFTTRPGVCTADTLIELRAANCTTTLASDDDDGPGNCSLIDANGADAAARNLPAGTYFVRVNAFSGTIAAYGVTVTLVDECGNGTKGAFEACDDNNNVGGDGCSGVCAVEAGYTCTGTTPSVCSDIDECLASPCLPGETCLNLPGSFSCIP